MAFVAQNSPDQSANSDQDKNKNPLAEQAPMTSAPAGGGAGKATGQPSSSAPAQPFTNLSAYLTANGPQVQQMGADIAGKLNTGYGETMGAIDSAQQDFGQRVKQGYSEADPNVVTEFSANPTAVAGDPTKAAAFKAQYNDRYTGPGSFQDDGAYADLSGKVQRGTAFADQVKSAPGLQSYLSSLSPTYTKGEATLDSSLLQANPEATTAIQTAANPYANLGGYLEAATATGNQAVANANTQAQGAKTAAHGAASTVTQNFGKTIDDSVAKANADRAAYNAAISANQPVAQDARAALLSAQQDAIAKYTGNVNNMAGSPANADPILAKIAQLIDPASYLSKLDPFASGQSIVSAPTPGQIASTDQYAEDAALQQLLGTDYNPYLDQSNVGQAGSWKTPSLPGAVPTTSGEQQYIGDIASLYGEPYGLTNANTPGGWTSATPQQIAQSVLAASQRQGQGVNPNAATIAALQRLVADSYAGR